MTSESLSGSAAGALVKIAWRNVWRSRKRSLILIGAVATGLWAGIFLLAFYNGMVQQRVKSAIANELSHIQMHHPAFLEEYDIRFAIADAEKTLQGVQAMSDVQHAAGRVILRGMIASAAGSSGTAIRGVMPAAEDSLTGLAAKVTSGSYFREGKSNDILVSERLLRKLKLNIKNKVVLTFQDADGNLASGAFRITGTFRTISTMFDDANVFIRLDDAAALARLSDQYSEIAILLRSNEVQDAVQAYLQQQFPQLEVKNWMELSPEIAMTESVSDQMVFIFMGIILLALSFGIINTMLMAVLERTRELGMLLALGMNRIKVFLMIILETVFLVFAGCPFGILLAFGTIALTQRTGIRLQAFSEMSANFGYDEVIYPRLASGHFETILLLVVFTALLSSLFPAQRTLRLNPSESLRK